MTTAESPPMIEVSRETSERKRIEESLESERCFLGAFFACLPACAYVFDEDGRFVRWNDYYEKALGWSADEMRSIVALDTVSPRDRERVARKIQDIFLTGRGTVELNVLTKDGREIRHLLHRHPHDIYR